MRRKSAHPSYSLAARLVKHMATIKEQGDEIASLRAQLVSCEGQWRKEVDANTVTRWQLAEARKKLAAAVEAYPTPEQMAQGLEAGRYGRTPLGIYDRFDSKNCPTGLVDVCRKYLASLPAPAAEGGKR